MIRPIPELTEERKASFWKLVPKTEGCWLWQGGRMGSGRGAFNVNGKVYQAHRIAFTLAYGPIPEGMILCHRCDEPTCVRPDHLFLGTHVDNVRDKMKKGRWRAGRCGTLYCIRGHHYTPENTYWQKMPTGAMGRSCKQCKLDKSAARYLRLKLSQTAL